MPPPARVKVARPPVSSAEDLIGIGSLRVIQAHDGSRKGVLGLATREQRSFRPAAVCESPEEQRARKARSRSSCPLSLLLIPIPFSVSFWWRSVTARASPQLLRDGVFPVGDEKLGYTFYPRGEGERAVLLYWHANAEVSRWPSTELPAARTGLCALAQRRRRLHASSARRQVVCDLDAFISEWTKLGVSVLAIDYRGYGWRDTTCIDPPCSNSPSPAGTASLRRRSAPAGWLTPLCGRRARSPRLPPPRVSFAGARGSPP